MDNGKLLTQEEVLEGKINKIRNDDSPVPATTTLPAVANPMDIMLAAVKNKEPKEVLESLKDLFVFQKEVDADNARKAYFQAMSNFKLKAPPLKKDKYNKFFDSWYVSLGNLLQTYTPPLAEEGLSMSFPTPNHDENGMTAYCRIAHALGHSETNEFWVPFDKAAIGKQSGQKSRNAIQDMRSTFTYARSTVAEAALGVAGTEGTLDDDGNSSGKKEPEFITKDQQKIVSKRVQAVYGDNDSMFWSWIGVETVDTIPANQFNKVIKGLDKAEASAKGMREPGQEG